MLMKEAREKIVAFGKRMEADGLTLGTAGNISIFDPELRLMAISPSGIPYEKTTPEDIVILDEEGNVVEGERKPSSEYLLHGAFYKTDPEARAVVHTHSMYCTILACMGEPLRSVHYAIAEAQTDEIPLVPYHTFGTPELANDAVKYCGDGDAVLLANHGIMVCGKNLKSTFGLAKNLEYIAELQYRAMCIGKPNVLTKAEMDEVFESFKSYGQPNSGKKGY